MPTKRIDLRPHYTASGGTHGWEVAEGDTILRRATRATAYRTWVKSVRAHQAAGFTVEAKAFNAKGKLDAHGLYKPDGTLMDYLPRERIKPECRNEYARKVVCPLSKDLLRQVRTKKLGEVFGYAIWLVNGNVVRTSVDVEYGLGGNPAVHGYMPEGEVWVEDTLSPSDLAMILLHELVETHLMFSHKESYTQAHQISTALEETVRPTVHLTRRDEVLPWVRNWLLPSGHAGADAPFIQAVCREIVGQVPKAKRGARPVGFEAGRGAGLRPKDVDARQLRKGMDVETEHTDDPKVALAIVLDHLAEIPDYYDRLEVMERSAERKK